MGLTAQSSATSADLAGLGRSPRTNADLPGPFVANSHPKTRDLAGKGGQRRKVLLIGDMSLACNSWLISNGGESPVSHVLQSISDTK